MLQLTRAILTLLLIGGLSSCVPGPKGNRLAPGWVRAIDTEVQSLGRGNWIVISEASFPTPSHKGTHTLVSPKSLTETIDLVIQSIESSGHLKPRVYATREASTVTENYAPGITIFQRNLELALHGHEKHILPQRSIDILYQTAAKDHRILLIKSCTTLPYTTIYIELESGYWDGESEAALRKQLKEN